MTSREVQALRAEFDRKLAALRRELMAERRAGVRQSERIDSAREDVAAIADALLVELPARADL